MLAAAAIARAAAETLRPRSKQRGHGGVGTWGAGDHSVCTCTRLEKPLCDWVSQQWVRWWGGRQDFQGVRKRCPVF